RAAHLRGGRRWDTTQAGARRVAASTRYLLLARIRMASRWSRVGVLGRAASRGHSRSAGRRGRLAVLDVLTRPWPRRAIGDRARRPAAAGPGIQGTFRL